MVKTRLPCAVRHSSIFQQGTSTGFKFHTVLLMCIRNWRLQHQSVTETWTDPSLGASSYWEPVDLSWLNQRKKHHKMQIQNHGNRTEYLRSPVKNLRTYNSFWMRKLFTEWTHNHLEACMSSKMKKKIRHNKEKLDNKIKFWNTGCCCSWRTPCFREVTVK